MKFYLLSMLITLFTMSAFADTNSSVVLNHLMTVGRNDQGFEKLPDQLRLNGWEFKNYPPNFYYVTGPDGVAKRKYEYILKKGKIDGIAMTGGHQQIMLYTKEACLAVYKESLSIKADESLLDSTNDILKEKNVAGPTRDPKDLSFGRKYAQNCKLIFSLDQDKVLTEMMKERKGSK